MNKIELQPLDPKCPTIKALEPKSDGRVTAVKANLSVFDSQSFLTDHEMVIPMSNNKNQI